MKIYWMSRHDPLESQVQELQRLFGNVEIIQDKQSFDSADDIIQRFKKSNADEIVIVAPLSVIAQLTQRGIHPLWAEMEQVPEDKAEVVASGRGYRFVKFKRIRRVALEFEEL